MSPRDISAGQSVTFSALVSDRGPADAGRFHIKFLLDGTRSLGVVEVEGLHVNDSVQYAVEGWTSTLGNHTISAYVDAYGEVAETDEMNNALTVGFTVVGTPDLSVSIVNIEKEQLKTDLGALAPNPVGRRIITVDVCNAGTAASVRAPFTLRAEASAPASGHSTSDTIAEETLAPLARQQCITLRLSWDAARNVGDVRFTAKVEPRGQDANPWNDYDERDDYTILGGLGGVILPRLPAV